MRNGKIIGSPNSASYAYCKKDGLQYLNKVIAVKSASEVVAYLNCPCIVDESFYEQLEEVVSIHFKDVDAGEAINMITLAHGQLMKDEEEQRVEHVVYHRSLSSVMSE